VVFSNIPTCVSGLTLENAEWDVYSNHILFSPFRAHLGHKSRAIIVWLPLFFFCSVKKSTSEEVKKMKRCACACLCACVCVYLAMLAQPLIADNYIFPELELFINEQSWTGAAEVRQQAGQLFLEWEGTTIRACRVANMRTIKMLTYGFLAYILFT